MRSAIYSLTPWPRASARARARAAIASGTLAESGSLVLFVCFCGAFFTPLPLPARRSTAEQDSGAVYGSHPASNFLPLLRAGAIQIPTTPESKPVSRCDWDRRGPADAAASLCDGGVSRVGRGVSAVNARGLTVAVHSREASESSSTQACVPACGARRTAAKLKANSGVDLGRAVSMRCVRPQTSEPPDGRRTGWARRLRGRRLPKIQRENCAHPLASTASQTMLAHREDGGGTPSGQRRIVCGNKYDVTKRTLTVIDGRSCIGATYLGLSVVADADIAAV